MTQAAALDRIYAPVQRDLEALERLFRAELSSEDAFVGELVTHVLTTRGKMLRPALVCLSALAAGGGDGARLGVAAAVELIHVASLIHDDVIDAADRRRGLASVNAVWGNQVAVLLGDYLFSKAFHILARLRADDVAAAMAGATVRMAQSEIKQIKHGNTAHTDETVYFDIIDGKTAALTSAACRCGALTAGARGESAEALGAYGLEWGMAFQITDDTLDVTASADHLGKPIGRDIQTGKVTLPVIYALRDASEPDSRRLREILDGDETAGPGSINGDADRGAGHQAAPDEVQRILTRSGAIDRALAVAREHAKRAAQALAGLPPSAARESLAALVEFVTVRTR